MSSLFFKNRQLSNKLNGKDKDKEKEKEDEKTRSEVDTFNDDDLPIPPPHIAEKKKYKEFEKEHDKDLLSEIPSDKRDLDASVLTMDSLRPTSPSSSPDDILELRRKETIAALAQMKYKLRNMGVLGVTGEIGRKLEYRDRNRASPSTAQVPFKPDLHALNGSEDGHHSSGDTGSHPVPVPGFVPVRAPASPGAQSKRAKSPSTLSEEAVPPPPPRTSHTKQSKCRSRSESPKTEVPSLTPHGLLEVEVDVDADDEDYGSVQGTIAFESVPVPGSPSYAKTSITASVFRSKDCEEQEQERGQGQGQGLKSLKPMALAFPLTQHTNLNNLKSLLHNDSKNSVKVASPRMTSAPNSPSKERSVSPRMTSAPNSPSKERSRGGAVRVVTDDTNSDEQRENPFADLCKKKEEKLRLKALQCKQIIR